MKHLIFANFPGYLLSVRFGGLARHLLVCFLLLFGRAAYSNDFFWVTNPVDNNWFNPANWSPSAVPGGFDAAHFGVSTITNIEIPQDGAAEDFFFETDSGAYTIRPYPGLLLKSLELSRTTRMWNRILSR